MHSSRGRRIALAIGITSALMSVWTVAQGHAVAPDSTVEIAAADKTTSTSAALAPDALPARAASMSPPQRAQSLTAATPPRHLGRTTVILYGDSLAWEAAGQFVEAFAGRSDVTVLTRTFGGTAICDFLPQMRDDATVLEPGWVVVEFSGNAFTPCTRDDSGRSLSGDALIERYRTDARRVVDIFSPLGTEVVFAGSPIPKSVDGQSGFNGGRLNGMYSELAAHSSSARFVDAGAAVLDAGRWTATLPCLPAEPCIDADAGGHPVNIVRAPDGGHFCPNDVGPAAGVTGVCPVWSSGAFRYASAMAAPVLTGLAR